MFSHTHGREPTPSRGSGRGTPPRLEPRRGTLILPGTPPPFPGPGIPLERDPCRGFIHPLHGTFPKRMADFGNEPRCAARLSRVPQRRLESIDPGNPPISHAELLSLHAANARCFSACVTIRRCPWREDASLLADKVGTDAGNVSRKKLHIHAHTHTHP